MRETRHALRRLLRQPGFSLTAVLTLAVCAAANLMIFAVLHSVLLRPLPFPDPDRLVTVFNSYPNAGLPRNPASVRDYFTRRETVPAFDSVSSYRYSVETHGAAGAVSRVRSLHITPEFFETLGVSLAMGRVFGEDAMTLGGPRELVVSHAFWRQQLALRPDPIGSEVLLGGRSYRIVGLLPEQFNFLSERVELFLPLVSTAEQRALNAQHGEHAEMLARLAPGASPEQALAQLQSHYARHAEGYPWAKEVAAAGFAMHVVPLHADHVASVRPLLLWLQAGALCLLLVGAFNLVNLLLVRANAQARELAVQRALGARPRDLLRPLAVEGLWITALGMGLGVLLAEAGLSALSRYAQDALPLATELSLSPVVLAIAALLVPVLGALLTMPVMLGQLGQQRARSMQSPLSSRSEGPRTLRMRHLFSTLQIASAFLVLCGGAAMSLGLRSALDTDPGVDPKGVVVAELTLPGESYPDGAARQRLAQALSERAAARFESLGFSTNVPVRGRSGVNDMQALHVVGFTPQPGVSPLLHYRYGVNPDYFAAMGIPLLQGRLLGPADLQGSARSVVVDEDFARQYWPEGKALGQRLFDGPDPGDAKDAFTVVGVVGSVRQTELGLDTRNGVVYFGYPFQARAEVFVSARTRSGALDAVALLRSLLQEVDPTLAADRIQPMQERIEATLMRQSLPTALASFFSIAALLLAGLGCFGVLSYGVSLRRHEIGLRVAVGARPADVLASVLGMGLRLLVGGALLGLAAVGLISIALRPLWAGLPDIDATAMTISLALLAIVCVLASLLPALRAASIPPTVAMRGS